MCIRIFAVFLALVAFAFAEQEQTSRLRYTRPEGWRHSVSEKTALGSVMPNSGGAAVTFSPSTEFAGTAEQWHHEIWSGILKEMPLGGPSQPGELGSFRTRMGIFNHPDGSHPWICLYTLVKEGRGEAAIFFATGEAQFYANLSTVTRMMQRATVGSLPNGESPAAAAKSAGDSPATMVVTAGAFAKADASTPAGSSDAMPSLNYNAPANFYQGAGTSPVEYSSREVNAGIQVYAFRPVTGDIRAVFQQTLLRDWIDPRFREGALTGAPQFFDGNISGATAVTIARFHEAIAGLPNERMRLLIVAGGMAAVVDVAANSAYSWQKVDPSVRAMLDSMRVERSAPPTTPRADAPPSSAPPTGGVAGVYRGMVTSYQPDLMRGVGYGRTVSIPEFYVLSADGRVCRIYTDPELPGGDVRAFDFPRAARADPNNAGTYVVRGNQLTIRLGQGAETIGATLTSSGSLDIAGKSYPRQR